MIDTFHIVFRTILFVIIIIYEPKQAINAFSIAQIASTLVHILSFIFFFWWYINKLNKIKKGEVEMTPIFKDMNDFQFESILDFFPGFMKNNVSLLNFTIIL